MIPSDWVILAAVLYGRNAINFSMLLAYLKALNLELNVPLPENEAELRMRLRACEGEKLARVEIFSSVSCTPEGIHRLFYHLPETGWGPTIFKTLNARYPLYAQGVSGYRLLLALGAHGVLEEAVTDSRLDRCTPLGALEDLAASLPKPISLPWLQQLPKDTFLLVARALMHRACLRWESPRYLLEVADARLKKAPDAEIQSLRTECAVLLGEKVEIPENHGPLLGLEAFLKPPARDRAEVCQKAYAYFQATASLMKGHQKHQKAGLLPGFFGIFQALCMLEMGKATEAEKLARVYGGRNHGDRYGRLWDGLLDMALLSQGRKLERCQNMPENMNEEPFGILIHAIVTQWAEPTVFQKGDLKGFFKRLKDLSTESGMPWLGRQVEALELTQGGASAPKGSVVGYYAEVPVWQRTLETLARLGEESGGGKAKAATKPRRLVWMLDSHPHYLIRNLEARDQRQNKSGVWSPGKAIPVHKIRSASVDMDFLTPIDQQAIAACTDQPYLDEQDILKVLYALGGHECLFRVQDGQHVPLKVRQGQPELRLTVEDGGLKLQLFPDPKGQLYAYHEEAFDRLTIYAFTPKHKEIAALLGSKGITVPEKGREQVMQAVASAASVVSVQSELSLEGMTFNLEEREGDATPELDLRPWNEGLRLQLRVRPLLKGPGFTPGHGLGELILEQDGQRFRVKRNLDAEKTGAQAVLDACPVLQGDTWDWELLEPTDCLDLLLQLEPLKEKVRLCWPEGQSFKQPVRLNASRMSMALKTQTAWFEMTGEIKLDEKRVVALETLLNQLKSAKGDFVPLGDGQWVKLEKHFREKLEGLMALAVPHGDKMRLAPSSNLALDEFTQELALFQAPKAWKARTEAVRKSFEMSVQVPKTFQAELRSYQEEGFEWMARLTAAELGACLADDMGLGKTIQALALLLYRVKEGPSLVLAPTSVVGNWASEARRFAPTLNIHIFGEGDRAAQLSSLGVRDVLLCSYGLLVQEEALLKEIEWGTVILDEAQAIKNADTKRSQVVMDLKAKGRVAMSGTPMENHLGELWNLFRFLNPGLLGSSEHFNKAFATPIGRDGDKPALQRLKRILKPFLLRRTKHEVLDELPSLTEIVHDVVLSEDERAFYESLRRKALEKLEAIKEPSGQSHIQILAELMRLRRACCHPRLVEPGLELKGSKLALFAEILEELRENNHRCLVFSQFVDHLSIIREHLDGQKISYQYLDGSTPAKERRTAIDAFQAGEGDCFLISLKAGGTGLNLTAADYVIHLDPWWNPAVEDQASARAHRMGQERPVTVYRLVTQDTIEAKILDLHKHKRHLADDLLEGTGSAGKLSADELMGLLKG